MRTNYLRLAVAAALLAPIAPVLAEDAPKEETKPDTHGLPAGTDWKLDFAAGWGFFGFGNSLYANSHDEVTQDLSDNWMEGYVKGGFSGTHKMSGAGEFYGAISGVGERTYNAPPPVVGGEASSFDVEDLYIGWRSGDMLGLGENALDFVVGRTQYKLGHGMLIYRRRLRRRLARRILERRAQGLRVRHHRAREGRTHHHRGLLPRPRRTARVRFRQCHLRRELRVFVERGQHLGRHLVVVDGEWPASGARWHGRHQPAGLPDALPFA